MQIKKKKKNVLLSRDEYLISLPFSGPTPKKDDAKKKISEGLKVSPELVVVKHIYTSFGKQEAEISAYVYESVDILKKVEPVKKEVKKETKEKPKDG